LVIEDNKPLADQMEAGLAAKGFSVDVSYDGADGEDKAYVNDYDAILLDLNLPDKDGIEILTFLRGNEVRTPVIIATARDEVAQRALGLDLGADDYIVKPFELLELRARIQAVIRRFNGRTNPTIRVGCLDVNPQTRAAIYDGRPLPLKPKEFDILEYIANRYPAVVSAESIAEHVYDEDFDVFSSVLRVHIARLKKSLASAAGGELLQTIRGKGYVLCDKPDCGRI
jgi:DNA-binding response OmpR family regulator